MTAQKPDEPQIRETPEPPARDPAKEKARAKSIYRQVLKHAVKDSIRNSGQSRISADALRQYFKDNNKKQKIAKKRKIEWGTTRWNALFKNRLRKRKNKKQ